MPHAKIKTPCKSSKYGFHFHCLHVCLLTPPHREKIYSEKVKGDNVQGEHVVVRTGSYPVEVSARENHAGCDPPSGWLPVVGLWFRNRSSGIPLCWSKLGCGHNRSTIFRPSTIFRRSTRRVDSIWGWTICFLEASLSTIRRRIVSNCVNRVAP